ncbi:MAG: ATP-binding cassette domain-containing protein [Deltaproteobacteria bacterium]|jgi:energy-coupling factor transport system ATP-binding protein|nr:ATP-binding cassette domain-containing protein [Deltaproteobacteria bacterium]
MLTVESLTFTHALSPKKALDGVGFSLPAGTALLVTGPSGSGKSTLLSILAGLAPRFLKGKLEGSVFLDGKAPGELRHWSSDVGFMTQNPECQFLAGNVEDELYLTLRCRNISGQAAAELVDEALKTFSLESVRSQSVFNLSEGQKQRVVLAALTSLKPKVLLLDEPSANLDPPALEQLAEILKKIEGLGVSLIIADHRLAWLTGVCRKILVLDEGRVAGEGDWEWLSDDQTRAGLGLRSVGRCSSKRTSSNPSNSRQNSLGEGVAAKNLTFSYYKGPIIINDLSFKLTYGTVTVLLGKSGLGKTTLARLLCGLEKPLNGEILFDGEKEPGPHGQVVLQNSDHQLYMPSVLEEVNVALSQGRRGARDDQKALEVLSAFGLADLAKRHPQSLSGGEKQRLVVAVGLARPTRLVVLDEPTSGLDGRNLSLMSRQIIKSAQSGPAVLVITHDLELVELVAQDVINLDEVLQSPRELLT